MKNRLGAPRAYFCDSPPGRSSCSRRSVAIDSFANEIYINVLVGGPVELEVVQKRGPIQGQLVLLEILERKRKSVVNANQRWLTFGKQLHQPLRDTTTGPNFFRSTRRRRFRWRRASIRHVHPQA